MTSLQAYSDLLHTLHSAPLDNGHWQRFLSRICETTESVYGIFTANDSAIGNRVLAHSGMPQFAEAHRMYNENFRHRDPFREKFLRAPQVGVIEGHELCPYDELVKTDLYREFLSPMDLHHQTFVVLSMAPRKYELISMWRGKGRPELEDDKRDLLRLLMPHVQTALRVRHMIGQAEVRAKTAEALLDASPTASLLLDATGEVVYANAAALAMVEAADGLRVVGRRLTPVDGLQRQRFAALVATAAKGTESGGAIALERRSGQRALQALVSAFHSDSNASDASVLVLVSDPEKTVHFPDAVLRALYDLTPAETEIANGLLTGYSLDEVAMLRRVSVATVRSQMKSLLGKTDTRRQGDLVRLLASLPRTVEGAKLVEGR